jgi:hypothetical protein
MSSNSSSSYGSGSGSRSRSGSNASNAPTLTSYLEDFTREVRSRLTPEEPGTQILNRLLGIHMAPNKRDITICIQTVGSSVLRIRYGMPAPREASPLFLGAGARPALLDATHIQFQESPVPRGQNPLAVCGIMGLPTWEQETARLTAMREADRHPVAVDETPYGGVLRRKRFRTANNILLYWGIMHPRVLDALERAGVDIDSGAGYQRFNTSEPSRHTSYHASGSEPRSRRTSSARPASSSQRASSHRPASGRPASRRSSSNRVPVAAPSRRTLSNRPQKVSLFHRGRPSPDPDPI